MALGLIIGEIQMSNELQVQISSVQDLLANLDLNPIETPQPLFRGEPGILPTACTPSLFRIERKRNIDPAEQIEGYLYEKTRVNEWYKEVTLLESQKPLNLINEIEKLILAQHYGIKTRLLDWTTNPLIALWFACREYDKTNNQKMYAVYECIPQSFFLEDDGSDEFLDHNPDRKLAFQNPYCLNIPEYINTKLKAFEQIHFIQPVKHLDARVYKQSSILSIHPNSQKFITPYKTYVIINKKVARNIMHELNILGVNFHTTGLATRDSLAKHANHSLDTM
ncbi:MAG: FRG domain-containing protein [Desulfobulbaceae bacterium]|nr:FRG domain-containing protein [Desulfobulbaceae bacterium]